MHRSLLDFTILALATGIAFSQTQPDPYAGHIATTGPRTPADERKAFHLPPGFDIELVAAEPDIHKPMNIAFDARGRLWVTESVEYPFPARGGKPRDAVKILEDFGPDGRARKISTYADGLNIPIGVLPLAQGALVYSIPDIYRLDDSKGDGHADRREVLYQQFGFRDTHGMTNSFTWGFDGWIYACHGYSNTSTIKGKDGQAVTMQSGNTYRMKPDGSHLEQWTHGQVNPFGLCFDPLGNLYSADCHTKPVMMLLRGGWYESFGKPHDGLGFAPEMCFHDHGSTAIAGIVYYAAYDFPQDFQGNVFVGNVVTNRINRDKLKRHGSTYLAKEQPDFLKSDDPWFRPVDLKLGPDGAMYVADFYNRVIGHYEVPLDHPGRDRERGRIWRIVYRGNELKPPPRSKDFVNKSVKELTEDLGDPNLTCRIMATNQLVQRDDPAIVSAVQDVVKKGPSYWQKAHGLWVLERRGALDDKTLEDAARERDAVVRVHAMKVLAERRQLTESMRQLALNGLKDSDAFVKRAAAEVMGQHPSVQNIRPLLDLRHSVPGSDSHLLHVVRMSLRDQLRDATAWTHLPTHSEKDESAVAGVATGVPSAEAAYYLFGYLKRSHESRENQARYVHHIARYADPSAVPSAALVAQLRDQKPADLENQASLFRAVQQGSQEAGRPLSAEARKWGTALIGSLFASAKRNEVLKGIELSASFRQDATVQQQLMKLASAPASPEAQRIAAVSALAAANPKGNVELLGRFLGDAGEPIGLREQSANLLARINQPESQAELVKSLPTVPARLQSVIAIGLAGSPTGAEKLLDAVAAGKASARLLKERPVELRLANARVPNLKERLAKLTAGLPAADDRLQEQLNRRRAGFAAAKVYAVQGAKIFEKHCVACHQIANQGSKIGPQLDGIGIRGLDRLLEDILDPNRNVDQAFRATTLSLKNGQVVSGLLVKEEGEVFVMADAQGKEVRVPKNSVEEKAVTQLSPMPANLADQIPEADFYNLLGYLLKQQPEKGSK